jgi:hypothetical protein
MITMLNQKLRYEDYEIFNDPEDLIRTIAPDTFVQRMIKHWTDYLGNVPNEALKQTWRLICETFNAHIRNHDDSIKSKYWSTLSPCTGSGKTQSLILYCALLSHLPNEEHPAVLIVTQLKDQCNSIRDQINELGVRDTAIAYHGDVKHDIPLTELETHPVVVITHSAYMNALDHLGFDGSFLRQTWAYFTAYQRNGHLIENIEGQYIKNPFDDRTQTSARRLIVIDEAINIVEQYMVTTDLLHNVNRIFPNELRDKFALELDEISYIANWIEHINERRQEGKLKDTVVLKEGLGRGHREPNFRGMIKALRSVHVEVELIGKESIEMRADILEILIETIKGIEHIHKNWTYFCNRTDAKGQGVHASKLLLPEDIRGAVIMDATADTNRIYDLHNDMKRIRVPEGCRDYSNVTLHYSYPHNTGKRNLIANKTANMEIEKLISDLNKKLAGRKTLIVCHKFNQSRFHRYRTTFKMETAYWGKIDGSNLWQNCDSIVIYGLNHLPPEYAPNIFFALQGVPETDDWFADSSQRNFMGYEDIKKEIVHSRMCVDIIQSINRVQCRKVIDTKGNCKPTDIYILLPYRELANTILKTIKNAMPNIMIKNDWHYKRVKTRVRASESEDAIATYFRDMKKGEVTPVDICDSIKMSIKTLQRHIKKAQNDPESVVAKAMEEAGIRYTVKQEGRVRKAYFIKR